ncbi:hypothetical protein EK21DRAFT_27676, partial [Setomelanomma holmii]
SLGIILLELCFDHRLEDHPVRKKSPPAGDVHSEAAFDLAAAIKWLQSVEDEAGEDYAAAVQWCFTGAVQTSKSWQADLIKNVV